MTIDLVQTNMIFLMTYLWVGLFHFKVLLAFSRLALVVLELYKTFTQNMGTEQTKVKQSFQNSFGLEKRCRIVV